MGPPTHLLIVSTLGIGAAVSTYTPRETYTLFQFLNTVFRQLIKMS